MESNGKAKVDKFLIASGFIGPIIFFLMIYFLFPLLFPGYDFTNQYISELGAIDSPVMIAANVIGFSLFGVFIMLFAIGIFRSKVMGKLGKASSFFIFGTGILMFLAGFKDQQVSIYEVPLEWEFESERGLGEFMYNLHAMTQLSGDIEERN